MIKSYQETCETVLPREPRNKKYLRRDISYIVEIIKLGTCIGRI
jgi:hypothetical protein